MLVMDNPPLSPNRKLSNTLKDLILTKKIIQIRRWSFLILVSRKVSTGLLKFPRRVCLCSGAVQCFMVCIQKFQVFFSLFLRKWRMYQLCKSIEVRDIHVSARKIKRDTVTPCISESLIKCSTTSYYQENFTLPLVYLILVCS